MPKSNTLKQLSKGVSHWIWHQIVEHWYAILTAVIGGGGMTYLASISKILEPYGAVAWGAIGILTILVIFISYALYAYASSKIAITKYANKKADTVNINILAPVHENQRINLMSFYHPYFKKTQNVRFENCELFGPAYVWFIGGNFDHCNMIDCEIVITRPDRPVKSAIGIERCTFIRCDIYRVTLIMAYEYYQALPLQMREAVPVISDGRIGDI